MSKSDGSNFIKNAINLACDRRIGVLDANFLCQSIGMINPIEPICIPPSTRVDECVRLLRGHKVGSLLIVDPARKVIGIFTERDCLMRVVPEVTEKAADPIEKYMTPNPLCQPPDITIAFALNIMSEGGFRHLPLVDSEGIAIGVVSVRDVMDFIVNSFVESLLNFEVALPHTS